MKKSRLAAHPPAGNPAHAADDNALTQTVRVPGPKGIASSVTLVLPKGMLEHAEGQGGLSSPQIVDAIQGLLRDLPPSATTWRGERGELMHTSGEQMLRARLASDGRIVDLSLFEGCGMEMARTLALNDQAWLRSMLKGEGVHVPTHASLWRTPAGHAVACDWDLPQRSHGLPEAFIDTTGHSQASILLEKALDAMLEGRARGHRKLGDGGIGFSFALGAQTIRVAYWHLAHAVVGIEMEWNGEALATWGDPVLDEA